MFYANPLGGRADQQFTNEGNPNADWNPVWDVRTGRFDGGWTIEMRRDFLRRSSVGAMFTNRSFSRVAPGSSQAYGVDGTFALFENVSGFAVKFNRLFRF